MVKTSSSSLRLSRSEAKSVVRRRLLDAALEIIDEGGEGALTTTSVTKRAGLAQSSFYTHFRNLSDLLRELAEEANALNLRETRAARRTASGAGLEALRDTYRIPLSIMVAHPKLTRLLIASRYDPASVLAEWSQDNWARWREALIDDLSTIGVLTDTPKRRRRAEMIAESIMAQSEVLALGYLDGRYANVEEMVDVCVMFAAGYLGSLGLWPEGGDRAAAVGSPARSGEPLPDVGAENRSGSKKPRGARPKRSLGAGSSEEAHPPSSVARSTIRSSARAHTRYGQAGSPTAD